MIAVLGPGGVGGFLAAMLARGGESVVVIAGEETARAIAADGLRLESGRYGTFDVSVAASSRLEAPADACFITVKATQLKEAVERIPPAALGGGLVVPLLNGLDHVEYLRSVYPPDDVVAATIRIETARVKSGLIRHTSPFSGIEIAAGVANRDRVEDLARRMSAAGLDVRVRDDEGAMLWEKFALLAPMALLTTHERANVGGIRTARRPDLVALLAEIAAVAKADGVEVEPEAVLRRIDSVPETMETSMQRDQESGRPLELDALGGAILRRANRAGIQTPVTARLVRDLEARSATGAPS
jgi:2-dehydropantoate 2-reductase